MKRKITVAYIEQDRTDHEQLKRWLKSEGMDKQFRLTCYDKPLVSYIETEFTADIIIIDTSNIQGEISMLSCKENYANLKYFVERHRNSLICITSYVLSWAGDFAENLKQDFEGEDKYIDFCDNGAGNLVNFLKERMKYFQ